VVTQPTKTSVYLRGKTTGREAKRELHHLFPFKGKERHCLSGGKEKRKKEDGPVFNFNLVWEEKIKN